MSVTTILESSEEADPTTLEINELVENINLQRRMHNEYQIIKGVVFAFVQSGGVDTELQLKVHNILMAAELEQSTKLRHNITLLGHSTLNTPDLTYEEGEKVKEAVQQGIVEKSRSMFQELRELGIIPVQSEVGIGCALSLSVEDKVLIESRKKLNEKQQLYMEKLQELIEVLENIIELKIVTLPEAVINKVQMSEVQLEVNRLRVELLNVRSRVNVFTETAKSMDAYREFLKDVLRQQLECKQEIEKLQELKEKYKQVSCKQYDEILKNYLQYKSKIENKKVCNTLLGK